MSIFQVLILIGFLCAVYCWTVNPGPQVIATKGEIWPKPQIQEKYEKNFKLKRSNFNFNVTSYNCTILQEAITRCSSIISDMHKFTRRLNKRRFRTSLHNKPAFPGYIKSLDVTLLNVCTDDDYPFLNMDEEYNLTISSSTNGKSVLSANSVWGILKGLESFSQLMYISDDETTLLINATKIQDFPRFPHRGLLLDTARHYLPVSIILTNLDAMSYNKMNVFHWHIVDDQSFPYQSPFFPELSEFGAFQQNKIYTPADVRNVIEYARLRGIRVIAEFDTPGHTRSWGEGIPELLTLCYKNGTLTDQLGPINPSLPFIFEFLNTFFGEINNTFPDRYTHLGGDEVPFECWESNPDVNNFMISKNITGDYKALQRYFMEHLLNIVTEKSLTSIVWEEVFSVGTKIPNNTVVQVWIGGYPSLREITAAGIQALLSSCWYLDHLITGGDWRRFYDCDPEDFGGTDEQFKLILGGEACMWGEVVNRHNVLQRTWPRASAIAEKLWSAHEADSYEGATRRIEEHTCRMNMRNIPAQPPNGWGYCLV